jgi:hypothetical protein
VRKHQFYFVRSTRVNNEQVTLASVVIHLFSKAGMFDKHSALLADGMAQIPGGGCRGKWRVRKLQQRNGIFPSHTLREPPTRFV